MGISTVIPTATYFNDKKLSYRYAGKGVGKKTIVLIHGFCEDYHIWDSFIKDLSKSHQVIAPDLPGFGQSKVQENITIKDMAAAVQHILQVEKIASAIIVGHSMGGYTGLAFAEYYPDMLSGLMLFHSTSFADDEAKRKKRLARIQSFEKYGTKAFFSVFFRALFTPTFTRQQPKIVAETKARAKRLSSQALIAATKAMLQRPDRSQVIATLTCPIGFLIGKQDVFVPVANNLKECHLAATTYLKILPNIGHAGMFEAPEETLTIVKEFVTYCENQ